jgi:hypothetical protein
MTYKKPDAYLESICASENCQWREEPYFAVSAISIRDILPQINMQGMRKFIKDLFRAFWIVNLMLALNRSLLNIEYILMNVLRALAWIISMCNLQSPVSI